MAKTPKAADVKTGDDVPLNENGTERQNHKPFLERSNHARDQENINPVELAKQKAEAGIRNDDGTHPVTGEPVDEDLKPLKDDDKK